MNPRRTSFLPFLLAPLLAAISCTAATTTIDERVSSYLTDSGASVRDCGEIILGQCSEAPLSGTDQAKLACLADCGTRLEIEQPTIEGDPIYTVYVRTPSGSSCTTAVFRDSRADKFGQGELTSSRCELSTSGTSCAPVTTSNCVPFDSGRD